MLAAVVAAGERVRELTADAVDEAGAQQELAHLGGLEREHLLGEVVADRAVVAGELRQEALRVGRVERRHRRQPQGRRPALGARDEPLDLRAAEVEAGQASIAAASSQVKASAAARTSTSRSSSLRRASPRSGSARDAITSRGRSPATYARITSSAAPVDVVDVVEDERLPRVRQRRVDRVGQRRGVVVPRRQRQPRRVVGGGEGGQQHRLARPGRARDHRQRALVVEQRLEPGARDQPQAAGPRASGL